MNKDILKAANLALIDLYLMSDKVLLAELNNSDFVASYAIDKEINDED